MLLLATQVFVPSKDGTKVPMFITHKKGLKLDGSNPTLLYGYGGAHAAARVQWRFFAVVHCAVDRLLRHVPYTNLYI